MTVVGLGVVWEFAHLGRFRWKAELCQDLELSGSKERGWLGADLSGLSVKSSIYSQSAVCGVLPTFLETLELEELESNSEVWLIGALIYSATRIDVVED